MKKRNEPIGKVFEAVNFMRKKRNKLSVKLSKMTKEEIIEYFKKVRGTDIKPNA